MSLGSQVRKYRLQLGWTLEDLENRSGVGRGTISALEKRGSNKSGYAGDLAKAFGLTIEQLTDESKNWLKADSNDNKATTKIVAFPKKDRDEIIIPQYETGGAMGGGLALHDQPGIIQSWSVNSEWLDKNVKAHTGKNNLCIVTGFGDSMRPMFNPGDPLLVDTGVKKVEFDSVYFFRVDGEGFIKRLQRIPTPDGLVLRAISENRSAYEPFDITKGMDFEVLGRVLMAWCRDEF